MSETNTYADDGVERPRRLLGTVGVAFSLVAFSMAALSPWIDEVVDPKPGAIDRLEDAVVDSAFRLKAKFQARVEEREPDLPLPPPRRVGWAFITPVALGCVGLCLGVGSYLRREDGRVSGTATLVGASAILLQYTLLIASAVIVVLLIGLILSAIGGG